MNLTLRWPKIHRAKGFLIEKFVLADTLFQAKLQECLAETATTLTQSSLATPTLTTSSAADVDTEEEREDSFAEISSAVLVNENIDAHTIFHNVTLLVRRKSRGRRDVSEKISRAVIQSSNP